ncbi:hypothetical protein SEA_KEANU_66 [Streptomyces phage Keanu]|nr:hypothetical protein SEA_KEANU_66 [Streptomyces phage Keanu]
MEHVHLPQREDPDYCAYDQCGLIWSDPVHAPSVALRKLQEAAPDLRPLAQHERASGAPFVPSQRQEATAEDAARWVNNAAPATHTGRPAMHSGASYVPADARWIMCPMRAKRLGETRQQCAFSSPLREEIADHLTRVHQYGPAAIGFYLKHPWFANEARQDWVKRTEHLRGVHVLKTQTPDPVPAFKHNGVTTEFHACDSTEQHQPHMWRPGDNTEWFTCRGDLVPDEQHECDHPNGFGVYGCPCGATAPDEPEEGIYTKSIDCPVCDDAFVKGNIRRHLQTVHQWTGDVWDDWAESVNFLELPLIPPVLADFLNPDVTMEQIMTDAATPPAGNSHKLDPRELEAALTSWWMDKASEETSAVVPKAVEYGATDLRDIGRDLADCMGREVTDEEATELGIFFYLRGKLSRWVDAVKRGDRPSDDTIYDIGVYCRMAQRNRDAGGWPGLPTD